MGTFIFFPPPDKYIIHNGPRHVTSVTRAPWLPKPNVIQITQGTDLLGRPPNQSYPFDPPLPDDGPDVIVSDPNALSNE